MKLKPQDHQALALWAADCAERVCSIFERHAPNDNRPRLAIVAARAWARGEMSVGAARTAAFAAHAAARAADHPAARAAARAAGHAAATAHMAGHARHAAAYALTAVSAAASLDTTAVVARERGWQSCHLPEHLRATVFPARSTEGIRDRS